MNQSICTQFTVGRRAVLRTSQAMALLLAAGFVQPTLADVISWSAGDGWWFDTNNWNLNRLPDSNDIIRIGDLPGVSNHVVTMGGFAGSGYSRFELSSGMTLDLNGSELVSFGEAWITGTNSRLIVRPSPGPNNHDFQGALRLGAGAYLDLRDNVAVRVFGDSWSNGTISGRGEFLIASVTPFRNDGIIRPDNNGGLIVTQGQSNRLAIDLDGTMGNGYLQLDTLFSVLQVNASSLSDSFSGTINMAPGALLTMNIDDGWTVDAGGNLNVAGFGNPAAASQINGTAMTFGGAINVGGAEGHLRVLAPLTLQSTAVVDIGDTDWVEFDGSTTVLGGDYNIGQGGQLDFDGPTTMRGGEFNTPSTNPADGSVDFNGATQWNGNVTINGYAQQNGDATVTGATVINAGVFGMDGASNDTSWQVNNSLVVNADRIGGVDHNIFSGTMNVTGGFLGKATINLNDPNDSWIMNGEMNLAGSGGLPVTRVAGSRMVVQGDLNLTSGIAQITADTDFEGANVDITSSGTLRMRGQTTVDAATSFANSGTLQNGIGGSMLLESNTSLGQVGLTNDGLLSIEQAGAGIVSVDRFLSTETSAWNVELGGDAPGSEHDLLQVTGGLAMLDGWLNVALIDVGSGVFMPTVGDEFTILTSTNGVSGVFANDPLTQMGATTYEWSVLYEPNAVVLRLDNVVPAPGSLTLLGLGGLGMVRRRRRA